MNTQKYNSITKKITHGIQRYFESAGYTDAVLGLSGGIDSAVVYRLGVRALGADHMHALLMPDTVSSPDSITHAKLLLEPQEIPKIYDISSIVDNIVVTIDKTEKQLGHSSIGIAESTYRGNIAARVRMIVLFDYAIKYHCLVMGTENKSEHYLGYFTLFGDNASCIEPIRELLKTEVFELAKYLDIPSIIIDKAPSADFWPGQTDEGELGFTYQDADKYIEILEDPRYQKVARHIERVAFKNKLPYIIPLKTEPK